jgi:hypothetical protein
MNSVTTQKRWKPEDEPKVDISESELNVNYFKTAKDFDRSITFVRATEGSSEQELTRPPPEMQEGEGELEGGVGCFAEASETGEWDGRGLDDD